MVKQVVPADEAPIAPFPFIDVNNYKSEVEPDGSVETGDLPEVNEFDD